MRCAKHGARREVDCAEACRPRITAEEQAARKSADAPFVIRMRVPDEAGRAL